MNKPGPKKGTPVVTTELCKYGCGNVAEYIGVSGEYRCKPTANSCPANRKKNSAGLEASYTNGQRLSGADRYSALPPETKAAMNWNKDKRYADFSYGGKGAHKNALLLERGHRCECCGLTEWLGKPITIELEHTDGDRKNNTRENLKLLCPNCHSQTPTWRRGTTVGKKVQRYSDSEIIDAIESCENLNQVLTKLDLRYGSAGTVVKIMSKHNVKFRE